MQTSGVVPDDFQTSTSTRESTCTQYRGQIPSTSDASSANSPGNTRSSGQAPCSRFISSEGSNEATNRNLYPSRHSCPTNNADGGVWSARGSCLCENVDGSVNLIAPPHFTNSDGINNGQRMCEDPVKMTDVATAEECKEAVQTLVLAEHGNDLANEIVFHEESYAFKSVPWLLNKFG